MFKSHLKELKTFIVIWFGGLVSSLGTAMTRFALLIWAYQQTGDATTLALLGFFSFGPYILFSPIAGVWVDRMDRRLVMLFADLGAALTSTAVLILYATGGLQIWHLYLVEALIGALDAFYLPAYSASITLLVPRSQYTRVSGMRSLAYSGSQVFAPFIAGFVLTALGISGVLLIDIATFLVALITLIVVRIPRPVKSAESAAIPENWRRQISFGFRYIFARRGLFGLLLIFVGINLFAGLTYFSILPAMILARSGSSEWALASVQGALGVGGVVGGVLVTTWGGPKRRIHGILAGAALSFLLGDILLAVGRDVPVWATAAFLSTLFIPFITGAEHAIWQTKVAPDVQGRVFSARGMFQLTTRPLGYLLAGPLADQLFEPAMAPGGALTDSFGWLVGTGPGTGMALMFVCTGFLGMAISLSGYLVPAVRHVEDDLPDYDAPPEFERGDEVLVAST